MIMVTHDREVAKKADRIIHILDGRVKEEEVLTHE
ncbi:ABC transporter ATP-binding protein [Staphylococcus warneri]|nr:ABC transporter ATP-binding protein [Staphylococcus warneri]